MDTTPLRLAVIVGSTREGRFGPTVAAWIADLIGRRPDLKADLIDPADTNPPDSHKTDDHQAGSAQAGSAQAGSGQAGSGQAGSGQAGSGQAGSGQAGSGQAGSGQAGSGQAGSGQAGKTAGGTVTEALGLADGFVVVTPEYNHSYPAPLKALIDGHFGEWRAKPVGFVSYGGMSGGLRAVEHLRPVFAELHAVTVRDTVSFHGARQCFGADGRPVDPGSTTAAERMLDGLAWWGNTLRDARVLRPYPMGA